MLEYPKNLFSETVTVRFCKDRCYNLINTNQRIKLFELYYHLVNFEVQNCIVYSLIKVCSRQQVSTKIDTHKWEITISIILQMKIELR